ncbi:MAG: HAD family hydrolase [Lachnospiraceae bacterium]|nr:HAD family hydrolase [Lachnospiraceae bacterium]
MIKTVIFDLDDTLYNYREAHALAFAQLTVYAEKELGIPAAEFEKLHQHYLENAKKFMGDVAATHNRLIRYQMILEEKGLPLYPHALRMCEIYWETFLDATRPFAGARGLLTALHAQNIRIGIGTNMTAYMQFRKLERMELLPLVDFLVSSEEASAEKPAPAFFARCVQKALCTAEECLFVGDSLEMDVYGALRAGLQAVWYHPEGERLEKGVLQITDLGQLTELLQVLDGRNGV